ncbi:MAG: VWA domain-containing protein, partial [Phycisphaerales bacterium]|nr:VWA domain-containing protein [Phycisphaerales bacterium]
MTVAPRYIPGYASGAPVDFHFQLPAGLDPRPGDIFLGQAAVDATSGRLSSGQVDALMQNAIAIQSPVRDMSDLNERMTNRRKADFVATYADGSKEVGIIFDDNTGALNNRWFYCPIEPGLQPHLLAEQPALLAKKIQPSEGGAPFASDTDQVPDASRITPTPTRPEVRAGHDISIEVNLQTGGPGITSLDSVLHEIDRTDLIKPNDFTAPVGALIHLKDKNTIPNKDFVLKWRLNDESIENQVFSYNGEKGGFLTLSMLPPARTPFTETIAVPRELIFVLDTSGSMSGFPIEKAKEVMTRAISQMRTFDAFNVITFAGATRILWDEPRQATEENIALANAFVNNQSGNGGTEMMSAINAALSQTVNKPKRQWLTPEQLLDAPINGDEVTLRVRMTGREYLSIEGHQQFQVPANHMRALSATVEHWTVKLGIVDPDSVVTLELKGRYLADDRDAPEFIVSHAGLIPNDFITAEALLNLPADGRRIELLINSFTTAHDPLFQTSDESIQPLSQWVRHLRMTARIIENEFRKATIVGRWTTQNAQRVFVMEQWGGQPIQSTRPVRICMFLTDGQVGNDHAIIEAVKQNAGTTRVFSFGVGNAPNRYLLDGIALAGRGAADYVTLADGADPIVDRFTTRIQTPLLSDVSIEFNTPMPMLDIVSPNVMGELQHPEGRNDIFLMPDLYDRAPITLHARFNNNANTALTGTATVRGRTSQGPFERVIQLNFPAPAPAGALAEQQSLLPTLWAREKVNQLLATDLSGLQLGAPKGDIRQQVITLGETFSIMTPFTSFVAVDRARVTIAGQPRLVHVPVELPEGQSYEGIFGAACLQFIFTANNMQATGEDDALSTNARVLEWVTDAEPDAAQGVTGIRRKSETVDSYRANTGGVPGEPQKVQQGLEFVVGGSLPAGALDQLGATVYYIDPSSGVPAGLEHFTFLAGSNFDTVTLENNRQLMQAAIDARIDEFRAAGAYDSALTTDQSVELGETAAFIFYAGRDDAGTTTRGITPAAPAARERLRRVEPSASSTLADAAVPQLDLEAVLKSADKQEELSFGESVNAGESEPTLDSWNASLADESAPPADASKTD